MINHLNYMAFIQMLKLRETSMKQKKFAMNYLEALELLKNLKNLQLLIMNKKNNRNNDKKIHNNNNKMKQIKTFKIKVKINYKKYVLNWSKKFLNNLIVKWQQ